MGKPIPHFEITLEHEGIDGLRRQVGICQVNVGKRCNQACLHCHVEAGPLRTETMTAETAARILTLLEATPSIHTLDITGGAPELNPNFRDLVRGARARGLKVLDRCNLTVLLEPGQEDTAQFLADNDVEVFASLPCYTQDNVDKQRGKGVFNKSVQALKLLNSLGYGMGAHALNLVYNPGGPFLPGPQEGLERDYRTRLIEDLGVHFTSLFTITNMPISRFLWDLERSGRLDSYMELLLESFNPQAAEGVMCRDLISIGYDGQLYDCDFNQMLELGAANKRLTIWDIDTLAALDGGPIAFGSHCYGCTAGSGSSCGGALAA